MQRVLDAAWQTRARDLPYSTSYDALIMASIIEKETARTDERRAIAGVFVRRLQQGMKLQTDPTVIYGMGSAFDGNLRRTDLRRDTPFNTYTRFGLPPTPIAMPGAHAIGAALNPAPGTALYFVRIGIVDARFIWYASVIAIVSGHVAAVYLAHAMALRVFKEKRIALKSQYPMLMLMIGYTRVSLWIIAQPIVTNR